MSSAVPVAEARSSDLSTALRERTRAAHERAESAPFVADLGAGRVPVAGYAALVAQHHAIYAALEQHTVALRAHPTVGRLVLDELTRLPHLEADLAVLHGPGWRDAAAADVVPATRRYVAHLHDVLTGWPVALAAHHYVRYLGDLSGGQLLRRAVEQHYGDLGRAASTFYEFTSIARVKPFRDRYRAILDSVPRPARARARPCRGGRRLRAEPGRVRRPGRRAGG